MNQAGLRCRHAFEYAVVHANGEVVCSIIDGRGDFVIGNIYQQSLPDILNGPRAHELRRLALSTPDSYCAAIGKSCALKTIPRTPGDDPPTTLRFLAIETTTACDLRCLSCPVRDFTGDVTWRHALRDGGASFLLWDGVRRVKQHAADAVRRAIPYFRGKTPADLGRRGAWLLRGRIPKSRRGTLSLETVKQVINQASPGLERIDLFNYGEPFLYRHLVDVLRHIRQVAPATGVLISTDGMQVREPVEHAIVSERLLDWIVFSVDGCDNESYRRYRIRGNFDVAFANLVRFHRRAEGTGIHVTWQYVVFRWNDSDCPRAERAIGQTAVAPKSQQSPPKSYLCRLAEGPLMGGVGSSRFRAVGDRCSVSAGPAVAQGREITSQGLQQKPPGLSAASVCILCAVQSSLDWKLVTRAHEEVRLLPLRRLPLGKGS